MEELFGARDWVEQPKPKSSKRQRRDVIAKWVLGNGLLTSIPDSHNMPEEEKTKLRSAIYEAADRGISALRKGELRPVKSIIAMLTYRSPSLSLA